MSRSQDEARKSAERDAAIERSKRVRQFDNDVARLFAEGRSVRETAAQLKRSPKSVWASMVWQTLTTGRGTGKKRTGRVRDSRAMLQRLEAQAHG